MKLLIILLTFSSFLFQKKPAIEGYFAIKFKATRRIDSDQFKPVFREVRGDRERQIVIAEFQTRKSGARIELTINAITAKKFKKATKKIQNDISTISIQGIK